VDSHKDHLVDVPGFEEVPDFLAGIADGVLLLIDPRHIDLPGPRSAWVEALGFEFLGPGGVDRGIVVLAAVGLIERINLTQLGRELLAPFVDSGGKDRGGGSGLGAFPAGVPS